MSLEWTLVACILYAEIFATLVLMLPFISAKTWSNFFKSRFMQVLSKKSKWCFGFLFLLLSLLLFDSIREMRKYSPDDRKGNIYLDKEVKNSMRLFRAQRDLYLIGFTMLLALIIKRLSVMIAKQATLMVNKDAVQKQALAPKKLQEKTLPKTSALAKTAFLDKIELKQLHDEIANLKDKIKKTEKIKEDVECKAKATEHEYDILNEQYRKLEMKVKTNT